jgi:hypothetical protein
MSSDSLWAENVDALQRQVAVLTVENAQLKTQLRQFQSAAPGGEQFTPQEISNRQAFERELSAMKAKLPALVQEYGEKYVAIREGEVVDSDTEEAALAMRVCSAYPDDYVLVRQVTSSAETESYMGAPLWGKS